MKTDVVFKFVNVRPVQRNAPAADKYAQFGTGKQSALHTDVGGLTADDAQVEAIAKATDYISKEGGEYIGTRQEDLAKLAGIAAASPTTVKAREALAQELKMSLQEWLALPEKVALKGNIWDSVLAQTLAPTARPEDRDDVFDNARHFYALEYCATLPEDKAPLSLVQIRALRILLSGKQVPRKAPGIKDPKVIAEIVKLKGINNTSLESVELRLKAARELRDGTAAIRAQRRNTAVISVDGAPGTLTGLQMQEIGAAASLIKNFAAGEAGTEVTKTVFRPSAKPWMYEIDANIFLSAETITLLAERKHLWSEFTATQVAEVLEVEARGLAAAAVQAISGRNWGLLADDESLRKLSAVAAIPFGRGFGKKPGRAALEDTPENRGIRPLGIGDLLVVKQKLLRYTAGEVAHIENVLKSEKKSRVHSRLRETEETVINETEELEETEKDVQTTERFELHKEAQKTAESSMSFDAGVAVTASYGPVSITAHADFALNNSVSESNKVASNFAKEVTDRSLSRIQRRTREERTRRTLERFEEKNEHGFDNSNGAGHVTGIYRWVDKYYRARVVNYGRRLMLEFVIPEPAAFYLAVTSNRPLQGVTLPKPPPPMVGGRALTPSDLYSGNYTAFIAAYNVQDAPVYPEASIKVGAALKAINSAGAGNGRIAETSKELVCPTGYEVDDYYGVWNLGGPSGCWAEVFIAGKEFPETGAYDMEGTVPISVIGWAGSVHINVYAVCSLKQETIRDWQLKAYTAIMNAYERVLSAYNAEVNAARIQAGVAIQGRNPDLNRKLERDELRKAALRMLTNDFSRLIVGGTSYSNFDFRAMQDNGENGYPEFDTNRAQLEGKVIQFFEQAFEWNNLVYRFYPYFWGRKENWDDRYPLTDTDPMFTDFLRAGAARVVVPVHPSYPETLLHYLHTSEIWNGGLPPVISDPLYISIIEELRSDAQVNDDADDLEACTVDSTIPCFVDEWEIKLPTTLVYLQPGSELPNFEDSPDDDISQGSLEAQLDKLAKDSGEDLDWRNSVVDLLKLLGRDSSLAARKALATKHGCPPALMAKTEDMNTWLRERILTEMKKHGGKLPDDF